MSARGVLTLLALGVLGVCGAVARPDDFSIDWWSIDGGGGTIAGGDFELSGTIGQADAGVVMAGGDFELTGGFWAGVPAFQLGDLNCDGNIDAFDIDPFVLALVDPAGYTAKFPDCDLTLADINGDGKIDAFDIDAFVALLVG